MESYSVASRLQEELELKQNLYQRSLERVAGTDSEWEVRKQALLKEIFFHIKSFADVDPPSKAVLIIGRIQAAVRELDQPRLIVADYESKRRMYAQACVQEGKQALQY
jgi:hypothetical protein